MLADVLERAADPEVWERFERQLRSTGYCRRPVRLRGQVDAIDKATGEVVTVYSTEHEPDETLLTCCGNRREAVCPSCANTYRGDAFQLVAAGMRGGKGVPESVAEHPLVFLTLTAPSFGPVHSRRVTGGEGAALPAAPRAARRARTACRWPATQVHDEDDPCLGEPICARCFDYEHAVLWNAMAPELWRRTRDPARARARALARASRSASCRCGLLRQGRRVPAPRRAALPLRPAPRRHRRGRRARGAGARARRAAADRRRAGGRPARLGALPRARRRAYGRLPASRPGRHARSGGARRSRCASSTPSSAEDGGAVRGLHRQVRDQVAPRRSAG